jgi:hypothetical protein
MGVFAGVFHENGAQTVVFWWSICGVMRGKRGALLVTYLASKNTPPI